jgi:hypothetical protein
MMGRNSYRRPQIILGIVLGIAAALLTSVVAIVQYVVTNGAAFAQHGTTLWGVLRLYIAAGLLGGLLFGLLLPVARWRWGAALLGAIAMMPLYLGAAVLLGHEDLYSGLIAALLVGGIVGYGLHRPPGPS